MLFEQVEGEDSDDEAGGNTPMHVAVEWNSLDLVDYFFSIGGEKLVRTKNDAGQDVLEWAYAENQEDSYSLLCHRMGIKANWIFCSIF